MPLNYKIINYKKIFRRNGKEYIDLLSKSYNGDLEPDGSFVRVTKDYVARPDLISFAYYRDDKYADILCKINGISNPFELNENMYLFIPTIETIMEASKVYDLSPSDVVEDDDELQINKQSEFIKPVNSRRSSNEMTPGMSNYVIDKSLGLVFYGQ